MGLQTVRFALVLLLFTGIGLDTHAEEKNHTTIYINLWKNKLILLKNGKPVDEYRIAPGRPQTPTPIGHFKITKKSKGWGNGFGSRWLGLNVPWGTYGIHGTNRPHLVGDSVSSGCIRMKNENVEKLYPKVPVGTPVKIDGPIFGTGEYAYRNLAVNSKGTLVQLVQNRLRAAGFYNGPIDGIYGESTKEAVEKFQEKHGLKATGGIKKQTYIEMGLLE